MVFICNDLLRLCKINIIKNIISYLYYTILNHNVYIYAGIGTIDMCILYSYIIQVSISVNVF